MAVHITARNHFNVAVLDCHGYITQQADTPAIRNAILEEINRGHNNILVNLTDVCSISLIGVAELVAGAYLADRHGGSLRVFGLSKTMNATLCNDELLGALKVFETEDTALRSFESSQSAAATALAR
jgi:anti-anti-sigma factor